MSDYQSNNKRIAKNTLLLYGRMLLMMVISLYASRVILNALGVEDYGIYNVVGSVVSKMEFLNASFVARRKIRNGNNVKKSFVTHSPVDRFTLTNL